MVVAGEACSGVGISARRKVPPSSPKLIKELHRSMNIWENYYLAKNVDDALELLSSSTGEAKVIAGGTDLLLELQQGNISPIHTLVDITRIPEMSEIELREDSVYVGAAVPLNRILQSTSVRQHAKVLIEACSLIGGPQVRNVATLGGNVAHALPAADGTIALLALDAQVEIASLGGRRQIPIGQMFLGPGQSVLDPRKELLVGFYIPLMKGFESSSFRRVMRPQGVAIAILNMAVWLRRSRNTIQDIKIAVGPGGPTPFRASRAEDVLRGGLMTPDSVSEALQALLTEAHFRTSPHRSTAAYRKHLAGVLLNELLQKTWDRTFEA